MNRRGDLSAGPQGGTVGSPVVLLGAVLSLLGVGVLLLLIWLRSEDGPGLLDKLWDGPVGFILLLLALVPALAGPVALILVSLVSLLRGGTQAPGLQTNRAGSPPPTGVSRVSTPPVSPGQNGSWTKLVEDCVDVVDELDRHMSSFDPPRQEIATHVILRLQEILKRSGVEVISDDAAYDPNRHKADRTGIVASRGALISETLSPGFAVGRRVLRRARVRVDDV